jgi:energy-coupling factor transporter ATP-binding protein EcfA2
VPVPSLASSSSSSSSSSTSSSSSQGEAEGNPREYVKTGVTLRECSGGQKHLIYVLRELAAERPILLLDELLCGLDAERQARVLGMLRERKSRVAMLFITTDLHSLSVMCSGKDDQVLFMDEGVIQERYYAHGSACVSFGACRRACDRHLPDSSFLASCRARVRSGVGGNGGGDMMALPSTAKARQYVGAFRSMLKDPAGMMGSNLLADMAKHQKSKKKTTTEASAK